MISDIHWCSWVLLIALKSKYSWLVSIFSVGSGSAVSWQESCLPNHCFLLFIELCSVRLASYTSADTTLTGGILGISGLFPEAYLWLRDFCSKLLQNSENPFAIYLQNHTGQIFCDICGTLAQQLPTKRKDSKAKVTASFCLCGKVPKKTHPLFDGC